MQTAGLCDAEPPLRPSGPRQGRLAPDYRRLFLGPGKTGQIVSSAVEHAPLKALIDSGAIAVVSENLRGSHPMITDKIGRAGDRG